MTNLSKTIIMIITLSALTIVLCSCMSGKKDTGTTAGDDMKRIGNDIKDTGEDIAEGLTGDSMGDNRDNGMNYHGAYDNNGQVNTTNGSLDGGMGDSYPDTDFAPDSANDTASGVLSSTPGGSTGSSYVTR